MRKKSSAMQAGGSVSSSLLHKLRRLIILSILGFVVTSTLVCALLRWLPPPTTAFMLNRHLEDMLKRRPYRKIDYRWVDASRISNHAFRAVIASEDQRFYQHSGFDFESIQSSIGTYLDGGRLRGASTISQQVAKNLFLNPSKSFFRKGFEVWFTVLIEQLWSKERILTVYLNIAEFGDHLFGIQAASLRYFGVPAKNLKSGQAALLAATLPNPLHYRATRPTAYLLERQHWILHQMQQIGYPHKPN